MDSFQYMYPSSQFGGMPVPPMGYSTAAPNPTQLMNAPPTDPQQQQQHQLSMMQSYGRAPSFGKASPVPGISQPFSSRVPGDPDSAIYCYDVRNGNFGEHPVRMMIAADGGVYTEHIPGYSLVYVPNNGPVEQVLGEICGTSRHSGNGRANGSTKNSRARSDSSARPAAERTSKPSNAFIMYRNFKIAEMRANFPEINQIEISRKAGDLWKAESEEVKERFRAEYRKQKHEYDLKKNVKRPRSETSGALNGPMSDDDISSVYSESGPSKRRKGSASGLGLGLGGGQKQRSRTMPTGSFNNSQARQDLSAADLRRQIVERSGAAAAFLNSSSGFESQDLNQAYAEMSASGSIANSPMQSMMGSGYMQGSDIPALSLGSMQAFPAMSVSEHDAMYASHQSVGVDPSALGSGGEQDDLAHSFVNAGIAAGINMMSDAHQHQHMVAVSSSEAADIAAAASIATSAVMADDFYAPQDVGVGMVSAADESQQMQSSQPMQSQPLQSQQQRELSAGSTSADQPPTEYLPFEQQPQPQNNSQTSLGDVTAAEPAASVPSVGAPACSNVTDTSESSLH
ncbi:hypothetical protein GGF46_005359 [Coemansia sp. RSA 552]|nr:hypothetical protein GGF46_005359 [Coemansia sp. RSA 552]